MHGIINLSVVPLRAEPDGRSEMVSQLLFGEQFEVLEEKTAWLRIQNQADNYLGWMSVNQFQELTQSTTQFILASGFPFIRATKGENETLFILPGSKLYEVHTKGHNTTFKCGNDLFSAEKSKVMLEPLTFANIIDYALKFINVPYLWGGKSPFGIDCSGFVQVLYSMTGLSLPRNSSQQANLGTHVEFASSCKAGDLAFFENETGLITHVGMMLDEERIIHASGRVRVDKLDSYGIFNEENGKHTHQLRFIKRLV